MAAVGLRRFGAPLLRPARKVTIEKNFNWCNLMFYFYSVGVTKMFCRRSCAAITGIVFSKAISCERVGLTSVLVKL